MWNILKYKNVRYFLSIRVWGIKLHFASVFLSFFYHICSKTWVEYFQCSRKKKRWASFNYCFMPLSECHLLLVNQMVRYCTYKNGWFLPFRLSKWYLFSFVHQKFKTYLLFFFFFFPGLLQKSMIVCLIYQLSLLNDLQIQEIMYLYYY